VLSAWLLVGLGLAREILGSRLLFDVVVSVWLGDWDWNSMRGLSMESELVVGWLCINRKACSWSNGHQSAAMLRTGST